MKKVPQFGRPQVAAAPAEPPPFSPSDVPRLPLAPGKVHLTDAEKRTLSVLGWKEGEPLPSPALSRALATEKERLETEYKERLQNLRGSDCQPLQEPAGVDLADLPPERQDKLRELFTRGKLQEEQKAQQAARQGMSPSIQKALEQLETDTVPVAEEAASDPASSTLAPGAGGAEPPSACPHCGWNLAVVAAEPSRDDALIFVQAMLGNLPFTKTYSFLGGALRVRFRTLPAQQSEMCLRQCGLDMEQKAIKTQDEFLLALVSYRLALSLAELTVNDLDYDVAQAADAYLRDRPEVQGKSTPLPELVQEVRQLPTLPQDPVWRLLSSAYRRFNLLVAALEVRADAPDFWPATVG